MQPPVSMRELRTATPLAIGLASLWALSPAAPTQIPETPPALTVDRDWHPAPSDGPPTAYRIASGVLGEERQVVVALPASHTRTERGYPLILVFDGESLLEPVLAATAPLARHGQMPEAVVVGVENTERLRDLSPPGLPVSGNDGAGRADRFLRFLVEELMPRLEADFRATGPVTLVGHSSGGLFVHYAALQEPARIQRVVALDAPMHLVGETLVAGLRDRTRGAGPSLRLVSLEARFGWPEPAWLSLIPQGRDAERLVREKLARETHASMVWPGTYRGLQAVHSDYAPGPEGVTAPGESLAAFDARMLADPTLPPPATLLRAAAEDYLSQRALDPAAATLERLAAAYGETPSVRALRSRLEAARGDELVGPSVEELLAAPFPAADQVAPLIGTWHGYTMTAGSTQPGELTLTVREEGGELTGEFGFGQGPPHPVEHISVSGDHYRVGYLNRMRPRGMLMYEGTLADGVFEGRFVLRGVVFRLPDGRELPEVTFRLERIDR